VACCGARRARALYAAGRIRTSGLRIRKGYRPNVLTRRAARTDLTVRSRSIEALGYWSDDSGARIIACRVMMMKPAEITAAQFPRWDAAPTGSGREITANELQSPDPRMRFEAAPRRVTRDRDAEQALLNCLRISDREVVSAAITSARPGRRQLAKRAFGRGRCVRRRNA